MPRWRRYRKPLIGCFPRPFGGEPGEVLALYELSMNNVTELLKNAYWNLNSDTRGNPFSSIPSSVVEEIIIRVARISVRRPLKCSDLRLLLTSGRVRNFKLEGARVAPEDLDSIFAYLSRCSADLFSIQLMGCLIVTEFRITNREEPPLEDVLSDALRLNLWKISLEGVLSGASKLEFLESTTTFNLGALRNCVNLKRLVLHFPVENHLFDFLEVDGQMVPHNSLRVLEIHSDVRYPIYSDLAVILRYCTELVEINFDVVKCLEYLHTEELRSGTLATVYKLEKCPLGFGIDTCAPVSRDGVYITSLTCPYLTQVKVVVKDYEALHALSNFHNLTSLLIMWEVMRNGDYHEGFQPLLEKPEFGHKLKSLHVIHFFRVDFSSIGACCPNLEKLKVICPSEMNRYEFSPTSFQKLIKLRVENSENEDWQESSLMGLLSNCTNLRYLTILNAGMLSDSLLAVILRTNSLSKVKELCVANCVLSEQGLRNLATSLSELDYFEMGCPSVVSLDVATTVIHEINPGIKVID